MAMRICGAKRVRGVSVRRSNEGSPSELDLEFLELDTPPSALAGHKMLPLKLENDDIYWLIPTRPMHMRH